MAIKKPTDPTPKQPMTSQAAAEGKTGQASAYGDRIRVRALADGYYEHIRRREGAVFTLVPRRLTDPRQIADHEKRHPGSNGILTAEQQFSERWMEKVSANERERNIGLKESMKAEHDKIIREKMGTEDPNAGSGSDDDSDSVI